MPTAAPMTPLPEAFDMLEKRNLSIPQFHLGNRQGLRPCSILNASALVGWLSKTPTPPESPQRSWSAVAPTEVFGTDNGKRQAYQWRAVRAQDGIEIGCGAVLQAPSGAGLSAVWFVKPATNFKVTKH